MVHKIDPSFYTIKLNEHEITHYIVEKFLRVFQFAFVSMCCNSLITFAKHR